MREAGEISHAIRLDCHILNEYHKWGEQHG